MKSFLIAMVATLILDIVWIGFLSQGIYKEQLFAMLRLKADQNLDPILWPALMVYLLLPLGICAFVLPKFGPEDSLIVIAGWGFLFGLIVYGVYDFTNYSLLKDWTLKITLVDWVWGGVLCSAVSTLTAFINLKSNT